MALVRFGSYNLLDLFAVDSAEERERYANLVEIIRSLGVDVLAVQEITGSDGDVAGRRLARLADDTGMTCGLGAGRVAVAQGRQGYHVGLLWRPGLTAVPESFRVGPGELWHSMAMLTFTVDGRDVLHASFHATPFSRHGRAEEMEHVVNLLTRPSGRPPGLVGADWNSVGADRLPDGSHYDHDPYVGEWYPDLVYQATWWYDAHGRRNHHADRTPGDILYAGGLRDAAAALATTWQPTTGHAPSDVHPRRRIDAVRVTCEVVPALTSVETVDTPQTRRSSDHLPVVVTYDPVHIA